MSNMPEIRLNWLDRTIGFFSPRSLLKRKRAKIYNEFLKRKYEGADGGRRTSTWKTASNSANAEITAALVKMRDRARDLVRNNPYAGKAIGVITDNVVGKGVRTQIKIDTNRKISVKEARLNEIWKAWAETKNCDYESQLTFLGLQDLAMREVVESGEVFVRRRFTRRRKVIGKMGKLVEIPPIELQLLEGDFLSVSRTGRLNNGNRIRQGIEFNKQGKRVAYHFYQNHPGSNDLDFGSTFSTVRVPASEVLHLYRLDRAGQMRGMTWFDKVILRLRNFDLYEDAQLMRQQCASMFTAFVHDLEGMDEDAETAEEQALGEKMEPGIIEILPPGKDVKFASPPGAENYGEYTTKVLQAIASGLGITYNQLTGDLSEVNFSSGRMGLIEVHRSFDKWQSNILINQLIDPTFEWFREGVELLGENMLGVWAVHTPPRREMIDPVKETQAMKTQVRSGFKTQSQAIRELGRDPDLHYAEIEQDNKTLDDKKITLDTDPRKTTNAGGSNDSASAQSNENDNSTSNSSENE